MPLAPPCIYPGEDSYGWISRHVLCTSPAIEAAQVVYTFQSICRFPLPCCTVSDPKPDSEFSMIRCMLFIINCETSQLDVCCAHCTKP
jgi:hypothetical protein